MKALAAVILMASVCAFGQKPKDNSSITGITTTGNITAFPIRKPIKPCDPKYEYSVVSIDSKGYIEVCAPIMHEVTEKEWQELVKKIEKLEDGRACSAEFFPAGGGVGHRFKLWPDGRYSESDPGVGLANCHSVDWAKEALQKLRDKGWEIGFVIR